MTRQRAPGVPRDLVSLGEWLKDLREKAKLQPVDIAVAAGVTTRTVHRWEGGFNDPGALGLLKVLSAVGASVTPGPPGELRAVNAELHDLRKLIEERVA